MTNDDDLIRELTGAVIDPLRGLLERMLALVERLTDRVEVLELEALHGRSLPLCTPNAPPDADSSRGPSDV